MLRRARIEVAREDERRSRVGLPNVVGQNFLHLGVRGESVVAGAFDVGVINDHPARPRSESDAATTPRLKRIEVPTQRSLALKPKDGDLLDRIAAQDCLTGERGPPSSPLADFLELSGEYPIQVERIGEITRNAPVATTTAIPIHLLQDVHVGIETGQDLTHLVKPRPSGDIPRHDPKIIGTRQPHADSRRFTDGPVNVAPGE